MTGQVLTTLAIAAAVRAATVKPLVLLQPVPQWLARQDRSSLSTAVVRSLVLGSMAKRADSTLSALVNKLIHSVWLLGWL